MEKKFERAYMHSVSAKMEHRSKKKNKIGKESRDLDLEIKIARTACRVVKHNNIGK